LTPYGRELGLVDDHQFDSFMNSQQAISDALEFFRVTKLVYDHQGLSAEQLLKRPEISLEKLEELLGSKLERLDRMQRFAVESRVKYEGYIQRQIVEAEKMKKWERRGIPTEFNFRSIPGLTREIVEKLERIRPQTFGQAQRISGITPAALSLLRIYIEKKERTSSGPAAEMGS
jgi:tRNA uridine 5-carboxymethylaminomethyl modification enzyme